MIIKLITFSIYYFYDIIVKQTEVRIKTFYFCVPLNLVNKSLFRVKVRFKNYIFTKISFIISFKTYTKVLA